MEKIVGIIGILLFCGIVFGLVILSCGVSKKSGIIAWFVTMFLIILLCVSVCLLVS